MTALTSVTSDLYRKIWSQSLHTIIMLREYRMNINNYQWISDVWHEDSSNSAIHIADDVKTRGTQ